MAVQCGDISSSGDVNGKGDGVEFVTPEMTDSEAGSVTPVRYRHKERKKLSTTPTAPHGNLVILPRRKLLTGSEPDSKQVVNLAVDSAVISYKERTDSELQAFHKSGETKDKDRTIDHGTKYPKHKVTKSHLGPLDNAFPSPPPFNQPTARYAGSMPAWQENTSGYDFQTCDFNCNVMENSNSFGSPTTGYTPSLVYEHMYNPPTPQSDCEIPPELYAQEPPAHYLLPSCSPFLPPDAYNYPYSPTPPVYYTELPPSPLYYTELPPSPISGVFPLMNVSLQESGAFPALVPCPMPGMDFKMPPHEYQSDNMVYFVDPLLADIDPYLIPPGYVTLHD